MVAEGGNSRGEPVVRLDGVRKEFGETTALDGVSLEIRAGRRSP